VCDAGSMRRLVLAVVLVAGCFAPRPYHRKAYVVDAILAVASLGAIGWGTHIRKDPDPIYGPEADKADAYGKVVLVGAMIGALVTVVWAGPSPAPAP
jgi:hypothetical protein